MNDTATKRSEIDVPRMVVVMKSGMTFWVTKETGERAQRHLETQSAHSFMRITELGETINTAEIAGVHSPSAYDELQRYKAGEFKCQWGKWHGKRQTCECKAEKDREHREQMRQKGNEITPQTPEERERSRETMVKMGEMGALDGSQIFRGRFMKGARDGRLLRRTTIEEWERKNGQTADLTNLAIDENSI